MANKVKYLVVDSSAFIKNAHLQEIGENIYTLFDVVEEIKDKATRQRLRILPYELHFREPPPEAIRFITDFSKRTGDYPCLSATDIRLLALTYQLHKENLGLENIRTEPGNSVTVKCSPRFIEKPTPTAGFFFPSRSQEKSCAVNSITSLSEIFEDIEINENSNDEEKTIKSVENAITRLHSNSEHSQTFDIPDENKLKNDGHLPNEDQDYLPDEGYIEDNDNEFGWITPGNIEDVKLFMGHNEVNATVVVGCITSDFAMQNILLHTGLNVISLNGMLIKTAKTFVLRCYGCFKFTSIMTTKFCPNCGNMTLKRVAVTTDNNGSTQCHISTRKNINIRGLNKPLPPPKGGKHARNPILVADQRVPQNRLPAKLRKKAFNVFDPDFVVKASPFPVIDTQSRAVQLGLHLKSRSCITYDMDKSLRQRKKC